MRLLVAVFYLCLAQIASEAAQHPLAGDRSSKHAMRGGVARVRGSNKPQGFAEHPVAPLLVVYWLKDEGGVSVNFSGPRMLSPINSISDVSFKGLVYGLAVKVFFS
jgi:hypothetical protein